MILSPSNLLSVLCRAQLFTRQIVYGTLSSPRSSNPIKSVVPLHRDLIPTASANLDTTLKLPEIKKKKLLALNNFHYISIIVLLYYYHNHLPCLVYKLILVIIICIKRGERVFCSSFVQSFWNMAWKKRDTLYFSHLFLPQGFNHPGLDTQQSQIW